MFSAKGVLAVPLLDWLAVTFVEIEALFLTDVEIFRGTLVESETLGMKIVEILGDAAFLDTEAVGPRAVAKLGDTIMETEKFEVLFWLTAGKTRETSIELNVNIIQV